MKLIKQKVEFLTQIDREKILTDIEKAARTCYKSNNKTTEGSASRMVKALVKNGHTAMIEMGGMITVKLTTSKSIANEVVRHRVGTSYAQQSTRYVDGSKAPIEFIIPYWSSLEEGYYKIDEEDIIYYYKTKDEEMRVHLPYELTGYNENFILLKSYQQANNHYLKLRENKLQPQQAREVLPLGLATEIVVSMNLRAWRHFLDLRSKGTTGAPHPDIKELADIIRAKFVEELPEIFD